MSSFTSSLWMDIKVVFKCFAIANYSAMKILLHGSCHTVYERRVNPLRWNCWLKRDEDLKL